MSNIDNLIAAVKEIARFSNTAYMIIWERSNYRHYPWDGRSEFVCIIYPDGSLVWG